MSICFLTYLLAPSEVSAVYVDASDPGSPPVFLFEKLETEKKDILTAINTISENIKKFVTKKGLPIPGENDVSVIVFSSPLIKSGLFGITKEWSAKASEIAASSMMLDVIWTVVLSEFDRDSVDHNVKTVVVSGGYNGSDTGKIDRLIKNISQAEWIQKKKPLIIFRGSSNAVDSAKLYFSPLTGFVSMENILTGNPSGCSDNIDSIIESVYLSECDLPDEVKKRRLFVFPGIVSKISELFCRSSILKTGTFFISEEFSVFSDCEKRSGKFFYKRFSIAKKSSTIESIDFSKGYSRIIYNNTSPDINMKKNQEQVFPVADEEVDNFYRPHKIIGIALENVTTFEKFLNLVSDPDILRGKIEIVFDNSGSLPALSTMLMKKDFDERVDFSEIVENIPVTKGWLIIPDGKFEKDKEAVSLHVNGMTKIENTALYWGKRYIYEIESSSSVEITLTGKAFFKDTDEKKITIKTYKKGRSLIVDLRKERS